MIAVTFPAFSDGRAYSQASLARSRYGYAGELRATGDVLIDQVPLMLRCGINSFAVSNPVAIRRLAEGRLPGIDSYYQPATQPARAAGTYSWRPRFVTLYPSERGSGVKVDLIFRCDFQDVIDHHVHRISLSFQIFDRCLQ